MNCLNILLIHVHVHHLYSMHIPTEQMNSVQTNFEAYRNAPPVRLVWFFFTMQIKRSKLKWRNGVLISFENMSLILFNYRIE